MSLYYGLPEPPELEGIDEDRLRELQNAIQEQLCQRDEERERNITKRGPHRGASTQCHNQQVLVKPRHQPSNRDQQAREKLR